MNKKMMAAKGTMYCQKCGAENPHDAKFCSKCGADLGKTTGKPRHPARYGVWLLIILLIIGGIIGYRLHNSAVRKAGQARQAAVRREKPAQVPAATLKTRQGAPQIPGMVYVPAGWSWMGCSPKDSNCNNDEKPYHRVYLDAYYIDRNDVTVNEYTRCVNAGRCTKPDTGKGCNWGMNGRGSNPINCVDWNQSVAYCQWAGGKLPTEAQWEKAARGTNGRIYPWGDVWDPAKACVNLQSTCPAGSYPQGASPYGVMDMAGNVCDWCSDWYGASYYGTSPDHDPQGPAKPDAGQRVLGGGSWAGNLLQLRTSYRGNYIPSGSDVTIGFRCVR